VIDSSTPPTRISLFSCTVDAPSSTMPSRLMLVNPGRLKVTVYVPGRKSTTV
jgi:hypothetical protein